jgi:cell division protein FtsQ
VTAVDIDPRIEARRTEVQREFGRKRLRVLVIVAVVVVTVIGTYLTVESPILDVDRVDVTGAVHIPAERVRRTAGIEHGRALLRVDIGAVARRVEQLPWVADAHVKRDLPGTLRIDVDEAEPVAYVRSRGSLAVIGADGRVVAWAARPPAGAVEIVGVRRVPKRNGLLSPAGTTRVLTEMPTEIASHVRLLALRPDTVVLVLDVGEIRLGSVADLDAKFAAAVAVMHDYAGAPFEYIDVTGPLNPVSRP